MLQIKQKNAGSRPEWLVSARYTFGTGSDNNYKVSGEGVNALQAALEVNGDHIMLFNLGGGNCVKLNGSVVERRAEVKSNDVFHVGDAVYLIEDPKEKRAQKLKEAPPKSASGWRLKAKNTALANRSFDLAGEMTIGRSNDCDICLNVVHLSRKHARISVSDSELRVDDLKSSNGTYVNGNKIESAIVKPGDEIRFDTLQFTVLGPDEDVNKTSVRVNNDSDATTLRPAIGMGAKTQRPKAAPKPVATKNKQTASAPNKAAAPKIDSRKQTTQDASDDWEAPEGSSNSSFIWILLMIIIAAAAAAYWFLWR
jgi:pSer/pThr/pTyr-binding forkhead associated (FHA) protein